MFCYGVWCANLWSHCRCDSWDRIHRVHRVCEAENGELLFFLNSQATFRNADFFSPLLLSHPSHPQTNVGVYTHTHTHTHTNTHTHGTPSCQYSMCSNMESLTAGQLLPRMSEWSSALSSVDVHRRMLFCLCLEVRLAGCCWDHANLWRNSTKLDSPTKFVVQGYLGAHMIQ